MNEGTRGRPNFARWLLSQKFKDDVIGELARGAAADPHYPVQGGIREVSKRLNELEADPDMHIALEDAELDWLAL